jgi:hypothetical protein
MLDNVPEQPKHAPPAAKVDPPPWAPPWDFVVHSLIAALMFVIVAAPAVALDLAQQWLERRYKVSRVTLAGLQGAAVAIFATDLALFAVALYKGFRRTVRLL